MVGFQTVALRSVLRPPLLLAAVAVTPFVLGRAGVAAPLACPWREVTGVPCPLCGATRSFHLAGQGDPGFLRLNGFWVLLAMVLLVVVLWSVAAPGAAARAGAFARRVPTPAWIAVVGLPAWTWAFLARGEIVG